MWEKLKGELSTDRTFYAFLIIGVGLSAFALGRYSVAMPAGLGPGGGGEAVGAAVSLAYTSGGGVATATVPLAPTPLTVPTESTTGAFVGSRSGTKYHDVRCSSAARIAEANRVYFATAAAAQAAGYTPAANCPLLTP